MLELIAENTQTERSSDEGSPAAPTRLGQCHEFLSRWAAIVGGFLGAQQLEEGLNPCLGQSLSAGKRFEYGESRLPTGIDKDLSEREAKSTTTRAWISF